MVASAHHLAWLAERAGCLRSTELRGLAAVGHGRLVGVVGFDDWRPNAVGMHVALETPTACRGLLRAAFDLPFVQLGLGMVTARVRSDNTRALELARHLGFSEAWRCRDGWAPGVDLLHLELRREACRFVEQHRKAA